MVKGFVIGALIAFGSYWCGFITAALVAAGKEEYSDGESNNDASESSESTTD